MRTKIFPKRFLILLLYYLAFVFLFVILSVTAKAGDPVLDAYSLRMNGKADQALLLLEKALEKDSTNAQIWYELGRTRHQIGLHEMRSFTDNMASWQEALEKAVYYDPDNPIYLNASGRMYFTIAYVKMMIEDLDAGPYVDKGVESFEKVLLVDPYCYSARLTIIEFLGQISPVIGGDKTRAKDYVLILEQQDEIAGILAREMILPGDSNKVEYWINIMESHPQKARFMEALGNAFIYENDLEKAEWFFRNAIKLDPRKNYLLLDLGRTYLMQIISQQGNNAELVVPPAVSVINDYLESGPILPMAAYAYFILARIYKSGSETKQADENLKKAGIIDPFFSQAFGLPHPVLYTTPGDQTQVHKYFFRPF